MTDSKLFLLINAAPGMDAWSLFCLFGRGLVAVQKRPELFECPAVHPISFPPDQPVDHVFADPGLHRQAIGVPTGEVQKVEEVLANVHGSDTSQT